MAHILICEDEPKVRDLMVRQLEMLGHTVELAVDGQEGFRQALRAGVDLVITDLMMPEWTGQDLAQSLELVGSETPILVVTGYPHHESLTEIRALPQVLGVLSKPWKKTDLKNLLKGLVRDESEAGQPNQHILIIDDDPGIVSLWVRVLEAVGYQVSSFTDPLAGMSWFSMNEQDVDLVILDLHMPGLDGEACLSAMRVVNESVPVLVATGYAEDPRVDKMKERSVVGVIRKPFEVATCLGLVSKALKSRR